MAKHDSIFKKQKTTLIKQYFLSRDLLVPKLPINATVSERYQIMTYPSTHIAIFQSGIPFLLQFFDTCQKMVSTPAQLAQSLGRFLLGWGPADADPAAAVAGGAAAPRTYPWG